MKKLFTLFVSIIAIYGYSQNSITWSAGTNISSSGFGYNHPRMVVDGSGNPLVIWGNTSNASVYFSRWTGSSFTTPLKINPSWMTVATASWMGPDIASKGDTVYVIMKRTPEGPDTNYVYIVRSFDGGQTFSAPVRVDNIADSISRFPTLTVKDDGNPIVAFMKFNATFGDARWVVATSSDFGATFSTDVKASGQAGGTVCDCCPGSIVNSGNIVAVLYRTNISDMRDSWVGLSNDNGNSFPTGFNIDRNNWYITACPSTGPDGFIYGDTLYSVFSSSASGSAKNYFSKSTLSDATHIATNLLSTATPGTATQNYPRIDRSGSAAAIVWRQYDSGTELLPILFTNNVHNGFSPVYDTVDVSNVSNADVALSNGNVYVVWQDNGSSTVKFRKGSYTPASTQVKDNNITHVSVFPNPAVNNINISIATGSDFETEIFNSLGQSVIKTENKKTIDVSSLSTGIYLVKITTNSEIFISKIVKK
jgi:hypothetical protein